MTAIWSNVSSLAGFGMRAVLSSSACPAGDLPLRCNLARRAGRRLVCGPELLISEIASAICRDPKYSEQKRCGFYCCEANIFVNSNGSSAVVRTAFVKVLLSIGALSASVALEFRSMVVKMHSGDAFFALVMKNVAASVRGWVIF